MFCDVTVAAAEVGRGWPATALAGYRNGAAVGGIAAGSMVAPAR